MKKRVYNLGSLQLKVSPFQHKEGELIRAVNVESETIGALNKRSGYATYLGTPDNNQVTTLFNWTNDSGTQFWNYRASGSSLYYSTQGTGDWTICGNGTITSGTPVVHVVSSNTLVISQSGGTTRHSTTGTSFTDTTNAGAAVGLASYEGRVYAYGTADTLDASAAGTPTDWDTAVVSYPVSGAGGPLSLFKCNDRLILTKTSGEMYRWDGFAFLDMATNLGPTSAKSIGEVEDFRFYANRLGVFGYGGAKAEQLSAPIERQIYNSLGSGVAGTVFDNAPGVVHQYDYYLGAGTITDNLTNETVEDAILKYDFRSDEWFNWQFADRPYSFLSYKDESGDQQLIFGNNGGQCFTHGGTVLNDNSAAISSVIEGVLHFGAPETDKKFNYIWAFTNPGDHLNVQVAISDTFTKGKKNWIDLKQTKDGVMEARFPSGSRGKLLFWKVYESSMDQRFNFYGFTVDAKKIERK